MQIKNNEKKLLNNFKQDGIVSENMCSGAMGNNWFETIC